MALTNAERQRRYRERRAVGEPVQERRPRPPRPKPRPARWAAALAELRTLQGEYETWRDQLPRVPGRLADGRAARGRVRDRARRARRRAAAGVRKGLKRHGARRTDGPRREWIHSFEQGGDAGGR